MLQAVNILTKEQALSLAFAVADVRATRNEPLGALTFLNDVDHPPNEDNIAALRANQIEPLLWSHRGEILASLNGSG